MCIRDSNDSYVYAAVRKVATTKTIKINYYSEEEKKQIADVEFTVDKDATSVNTRKLTAPEGYELVLSGDLAINDGYVYALSLIHILSAANLRKPPYICILLTPDYAHAY